MEIILTDNVKQYLAELPNDMAEVLYLRFQQGLTVREIAFQKKWSISKVYTKLNTGIFRVEKRFNPDAFEHMNKILYPTSSSSSSAHAQVNSQNDS